MLRVKCTLSMKMISKHWHTYLHRDNWYFTFCFFSNHSLCIHRRTNINGKIMEFLPINELVPGIYRIRYEVKEYFEDKGLSTLFPFLLLTFYVRDPFNPFRFSCTFNHQSLWILHGQRSIKHNELCIQYLLKLGIPVITQIRYSSTHTHPYSSCGFS